MCICVGFAYRCVVVFLSMARRGSMCLFYARSNVQVASNAVTFSYGDPYIGNVVNTVQLDLSGLQCPVYDPIEQRVIGATEARDVFLLSVRGFNFGPPSADGRGPLVLARTGTSTVHTSVSVIATMFSSTGQTVNYTVPCFEQWKHDTIVFTVAYPGSVQVVTTSETDAGVRIAQASNVAAYNYDSPSLRSNEGGDLPVVTGNGSSTVRIVGQFLFAENATGVTTRVTIGGNTGGVPIDQSRVTMGSLSSTARLLANAPNQYVDVQVPPWQGERVPLVIFKVFGGGNSIGSDPYLISVAPPVVTAAVGSQGPSAIVTARADGTTRIRLTGTNIGQNFTSIVFQSDASAVSDGEFTDCFGDFNVVECTAPKGVGALDNYGNPLQVTVLQYGMMCDPVEQSVDSALVSGWSRCTVVRNLASLQQSNVRDCVKTTRMSCRTSLSPRL